MVVTGKIQSLVLFVGVPADGCWKYRIDSGSFYIKSNIDNSDITFNPFKRGKISQWLTNTYCNNQQNIFNILLSHSSSSAVASTFLYTLEAFIHFSSPSANLTNHCSFPYLVALPKTFMVHTNMRYEHKFYSIKLF